MSTVSRFSDLLLRYPARTLGWALVVAVFVWSYGATLASLVNRWWTESDYIYGFLVIPFSVVLLWLRRDRMPQSGQGSLTGVLFLAVAGLMRFLSAYYHYELLDPLSIVPCLMGIALLGGGWPAMRWAWPAILYLAFMVPLPGFLAAMLSQPLQQIGATTSTYLLQTLGIPAVAKGTVIGLSRWELGVEEACSGLRMLMLFLAVCTAAALVIHRDAWQRAILVLSAAPIAVIANVIRITATGILYETAGPELGGEFYHRLAGYFMMPVAVVLTWAEMGILSMIFQPKPDWDVDWI